MGLRGGVTRLEVCFLSCVGREVALRETLEDFAGTDWPEVPLVHTDRGEAAPGDGAIVRGVCGALAQLLETDAEWLLLLEDDVRCHPRLWHSLTHWPPLRGDSSSSSASVSSQEDKDEDEESDEEVGMQLGLLYNPQIQPLLTVPVGRYFLPRLRSVLGSQARLFARKFAARVLAEVHGPGLPKDLRIARLLPEPGAIRVHCPRSSSTWAARAPGAGPSTRRGTLPRADRARRRPRAGGGEERGGG